MVEMMMYSMSQKDEDDDNISLGDFTSEGGSEVEEADDEDMKYEDQDLDSEDQDPEFEDEDIDSLEEDFYLKEEAVLEEEESALLVEALAETSQVDSHTVDSPDQPQPVFSSNEGIGLLKTNFTHVNRQQGKYIYNFLYLCYFINMLAPK